MSDKPEKKELPKDADLDDILPKKKDVEDDKAEIVQQLEKEAKDPKQQALDAEEKQKKEMEAAEEQKKQDKELEVATNLDNAAMTKFDQELLTLHNKMRTHPQAFIEELEQYNSTFSGRQAQVLIDGKNVTVQTSEGHQPVTELIERLKKQKPLEPLVMNEALRNSSCLHVKDQGSTGEEGHKSSNGSSFMQRVKEEHLNTTGYVLGENIAYGSDDAKTALMILAIDDGNPQRNHRKNMLSTQWTQVGICNGKHKLLEHMSVLIYRGTTEKLKPEGKEKSVSDEKQQILEDQHEQEVQEKNDQSGKIAVMDINNVVKKQGGALGKLESLEDDLKKYHKDHAAEEARTKDIENRIAAGKHVHGKEANEDKKKRNKEFEAEKEAAEQVEFTKMGKPPKKANVDSLKIGEEVTEKESPEESVGKVIKVSKEDKKSESSSHLDNVNDAYESKQTGKSLKDYLKTTKEDGDDDENSKMEPWEKELKDFKKSGMKTPGEGAKEDSPELKKKASEDKVTKKKEKVDSPDMKAFKAAKEEVKSETTVKEKKENADKDKSEKELKKEKVVEILTKDDKSDEGVATEKRKEVAAKEENDANPKCEVSELIDRVEKEKEQLQRDQERLGKIKAKRAAEEKARLEKEKAEAEKKKKELEAKKKKEGKKGEGKEGEKKEGEGKDGEKKEGEAKPEKKALFQKKAKDGEITVDIPQRDFDWRPKQLRERLDDAPDSQHEHAKEHGLDWNAKENEAFAANLPEKYMTCPDCKKKSEKTEEDEVNEADLEKSDDDTETQDLHQQEKGKKETAQKKSGGKKEKGLKKKSSKQDKSKK